MKLNKIYFIFFINLLLSGNAILAQPNIKNIQCDNSSILQQADSLKQLFAKDNFTLLKEASLTMDSEYEVPVIVPLKGGTWYKVIFIGDMSSKVYEVRMYNRSEEEVMYQKKMWGDIDGNIISYDYIPPATDYHMIKPVQVNKKLKKNLCGYIMLFKKTPPEKNLF